MAAGQRVRDLWKKFVTVGAVVFLWVGAVLFVLAAAFAVHSWLLLRHGMRAQATVTENVPVQGPDGVVVYQTHVRFHLPSGELVAFVDPIQSSQDDGPAFAPGTIVPVIYPAGRPASAIIATTWRVYFLAIILGGLGVVFLDLGLILQRVKRRRLT